MNSTPEITINKDLVSCCWLYCGACAKFLAGNCRGCKKMNKTPFWCSIRDCCISKAYDNCATCKEYVDVAKCRKYNGFIMRTLGYLCGSNRFAATSIIRDKGIQEFAKYMAEKKIQRIPRKKEDSR